MRAASGNHFLPYEIQRDIIGRLELPSLKALRLASQTLAAIGAEYLLPEVHLLFRKASLERLELISRHPIISQHVTALIYDADRGELQERWKWANHLTESHLRARRPLGAPFDAAPELWPEYESLPHVYSKDETCRGWANYLDILTEQQDITTRNLDDQVARAISCFPKLSHIYLSIGAKTRPHSNALILSYAPGLVLPLRDWFLDAYNAEPNGLHQFTSLSLFTPERSDLPSPLNKCMHPAALRTLHIGKVTWKIFSATWPAQQAAYQTLMAQVTDVNLSLNVSQPWPQVDPGAALQDEANCRRFFLETEALRIFLMAAPMLEKFHVEFNHCYMGSKMQIVDLKSLVGDVGEFTWKSLREVDFQVNTGMEELIDFLTRHQKTLRKLTMSDGLTLLGPDVSVATLLSHIRDAVEWEDVLMAGSLFVKGLDKWWYFGMPGDGDYVPEDSFGYEEEPMKSMQAVREFLMRKSEVNPFERWS